MLFAATLEPDGSVVKTRLLVRADAEALRRAGGNVVVVGPDKAANRRLARDLESTACGPYVTSPPHPNAGPNALPHCQPINRPPYGHTFYEVDKRKAR